MQTKVSPKLDPIKLEQLLKSNPLSGILTKAQRISTLNRVLFNTLPADLRTQCQVVNVDVNTLIIGTASSPVASRLYYQQNSLLSAIKTQAPKAGIAHIRIKVNPHF